MNNRHIFVPACLNLLLMQVGCSDGSLEPQAPVAGSASGTMDRSNLPIQEASGPKYSELDFVYDSGGLGKGGMATLSVNGETVAGRRIGKTQPWIFSADETADVGLDNQTPVAIDNGVGRDETRFTGTINKVTLDVKDVV